MALMVDQGDEMVWSLVMFDLPVKTKPQQREATFFRNLLLDLGYEMVQYSVYVRYLPLPSLGSPAIQKIKRSLPADGLVRIINISDRAWSSAFRFSNEVPQEAESRPGELTIF